MSSGTELTLPQSAARVGDRLKAIDLPYWALGIVLVGYVLVFSWAAFFKFDTFRMGFDLGVYEQAIWNTSQGRPFESSVFTYTGNHLGSDPVVIEALLAIPYAILPSTYTLLFLQVVIAAVGAFGIFLLARDKLNHLWGAVILTACYLAYAPMQYLVLYEFQPRLFAIAALIFMFYFMEKRALLPFLACMVVALVTRSDVALVVGMFGIYALLNRKPWQFVILPIVFGALWFAVALAVIVPAFRYGGQASVYIDTYRWLGNSLSEMLLTLLTRPLYLAENVLTPGKLTFLFNLLVPFAFIPLLRPLILLIPLPILTLNLLSPDRIQWDIRNHYDALILPFIAIAAVYGIETLTRWGRARKWALAERMPAVWVGLVAVMIVITNYTLGNPVVGLTRRVDAARIAAANAVLAQVPPHAPVAAHNFLAPHLARRRYLYFFPPHQFYTNNPLERAEYVVVDLRYDGGKTQAAAMAELQNGEDWVELTRAGDYALYKKQ